MGPDATCCSGRVTLLRRLIPRDGQRLLLECRTTPVHGNLCRSASTDVSPVPCTPLRSFLLKAYDGANRTEWATESIATESPQVAFLTQTGTTAPSANPPL